MFRHLGGKLAGARRRGRIAAAISRWNVLVLRLEYRDLRS
jgi:hypothetical protein